MCPGLAPVLPGLIAGVSAARIPVAGNILLFSFFTLLLVLDPGFCSPPLPRSCRVRSGRTGCFVSSDRRSASPPCALGVRLLGDKCPVVVTSGPATMVIAKLSLTRIHRRTGDGGLGEVIFRDGSRMDGDGGGLRWPCWDADRGIGAARDARSQVGGSPAGTFGWLVGEGGVSGPVAGGLVRPCVEWLAIEPGRD